MHSSSSQLAAAVGAGFASRYDAALDGVCIQSKISHQMSFYGMIVLGYHHFILTEVCIVCL